MPLFNQFQSEIDEVLNGLILQRVFAGHTADYATYQGLAAAAARLVWEARTERQKLGDFAEEFFRRLALRLAHPMLLRKSELHRLVHFVDPQDIPEEVAQKLDLLASLFASVRPSEETRM